MINTQDSVTVFSETRWTANEIQEMTLPDRIALQDRLTKEDKLTAVLIVDAAVQGKSRILQGLLTVAAFEKEFGSLNEELHNFRNWLQSLLS